MNRKRWTLAAIVVVLAAAAVFVRRNALLRDTATYRFTTILKGDVEATVSVESIVLGVMGGVLGLATGFIGAKVLGHFTGWETVMSPLVMLVAIGFSGAVGVFFGYYPARKAAALNPIEALRYE